MQGPNGEVNGFDVVVTMDGVAIASQRNVTFNEQTAAIDLSSKERREYVGIPGRYNSTLSLEHLYIPTSSGHSALRAAMRNGTMVTLMRKELGSDLESADCIVTGLGTAAPDQDGVVVSADFQVSGPWTAA